MSDSAKNMLLGFLAAVVLIGGPLLWWMASRPKQADPVLAKPEDVKHHEAAKEKIRSLSENAARLEAKANWCDAATAWQKVQDAVKEAGSPDFLALDRLAAERNKAACEEQCQPKNLVKQVELRPEPKKQPPKIEANELLRFYPAGKTIRSLAITNMDGKASNTDWGLKGEASFVHLLEALIETKILSNDGQRVRFHISLRKVTQTLVVSKETLELALPQAPILEQAWADVALWRLNPGVAKLRLLWEGANLVDPNLKKTLTGVAEHLKRVGIAGGPPQEVQMLQQLDKTSGLEVEADYMNGIGIVRLEVVGGRRGNLFDEHALKTLGDHLAPLMDFHLFPNANKAVGERWKVRAQDILRAAPIDFNAEIDGFVELERKPDDAKDRAGIAILGVIDGKLQADGRAADAVRRGELKVRTGELEFSMQDLFVRRGELTFDVRSTFASRDHLLFRAENLRNLRIRSRYEAQIVK
ncbi:MAG: hypothetical protein U0744_14100 [Gemmataceae bacterium]